MREIKFRAYDIKNKIMHYNFQCIKSGDNAKDWIIFISDKQPLENIKTNPFINPNPYFSQQFKIMQDTGLKDVSGKEIYEGDIVRWGMNGVELSGVRYAIVNLFPSLSFDILFYENEKTKERKNGNFSFKFDSFIYTDTEKYLEIVGNIFEEKLK